MAKVSEPKPCRDKECGAMIRFIENPRTGKKMPVDAEPVIVRVNSSSQVIVTEDGQVVKGPSLGSVGYTPHWVTCPGAAKFKSFKKPAPIDTRRM